jgi:hypothetical protein
VRCAVGAAKVLPKLKMERIAKAEVVFILKE